MSAITSQELSSAVTDCFLPSLAAPLPPYAAIILAKLVSQHDPRLLSALQQFPLDAKPAPPSTTSSYSSSSTPTFYDLPHAFSAAILEEYQEDWHKLFAAHSTDLAKKTSKNERDELGLKKASLVYGEISFVSFGIAFLNFMQLPPGGVFYDLGSGSGRALFAAEMLHDFKKLVGVEILEGLHQVSMSVLEKFRETRPDAADKNIEFHRADFLEYDWSDGDMVFANSTCFDEALMINLGQKGRLLKEGAYFVTFTKQLKSPYFDVLHSKQYKMSWGVATVHIQRRNSKPAEDE